MFPTRDRSAGFSWGGGSRGGGGLKDGRSRPGCGGRPSVHRLVVEVTGDRRIARRRSGPGGRAADPCSDGRDAPTAPININNRPPMRETKL